MNHTHLTNDLFICLCDPCDQSRHAAEGLIGVHVNSICSSAVAVEVNCETDFVVRNELFRNLVSHLTKTVEHASIVNGSGNKIIGDGSSLTTRYFLVQDQMDSFKDQIIPTLTQLGENIVLKRAMIMKSAPDSGVKITGYAHAVGGQTNSHNGIHVGKYGTLLAYAQPAEPDDPAFSATQDVDQIRKQNVSNQEKAEAAEKAVKQEETDAGKGNEGEVSGEVIAAFEEDSFEQSRLDTDSMSQDHVAKLICQHIIGMKPAKIRETIEERKERERLRQLRRESGHKDDDEDDSDALLDQKFLLDQQVTIRQLLKEKNMRVVDFIRFECGVGEDQ